MYEINLLPSELRENNDVKTKKLLRLAVVVIGVSLLFAYGAFTYKLHILKREIAETEAGLLQLQSTVQQVENLKRQRQDDELLAQEFKALLEDKNGWFGLFEELRVIIPVDIYLENIEIYFADVEPNFEPSALPGGISRPVAGPANAIDLTGYSGTVASVGALMNTLNNMPYIAESNLMEIKETSGAETVKFKITATLSESIR